MSALLAALQAEAGAPAPRISAAVQQAHTALADALRPQFGAEAQLLAEAVVSLVGGSTGLVYPVGRARQRPLVVTVVIYVLGQPDCRRIPARQRRRLLAGVKAACAALRRSPFRRRPTWEGSPIATLVYELSRTPVFPRGVAAMLRNLRAILAAAQAKGSRQVNLPHQAQAVTAPLLRFARLTPPAEAHALPPYPRAADLLTLLVRQVDRHPPPDRRGTRKTRETYVSDLRRLLEDDTPARWAARAGREPDADQIPPNDPRRRPWRRAARAQRDELRSALCSSGDGESSPRPKNEHPPFFRDAWPNTVYANITRQTPGVLQPSELAGLAGGLARLPTMQAAAPLAVLFGGIAYGWTRQWETAHVIAGEPDPFTHPGLLISLDGAWASVRPLPTHGTPLDLQPLKSDRARYDDRQEELRRHYEPLDTCYWVALHPALAQALQVLTHGKVTGDVLLGKTGYRAAIKILDGLLQAWSPRATALTPGRLNLTFQGWAGAGGLDSIDRYALSGRASDAAEMPANYTHIVVADTCRRQRRFFNAMLKEINDDYCALAGFAGLAAA